MTTRVRLIALITLWGMVAAGCLSDAKEVLGVGKPRWWMVADDFAISLGALVLVSLAIWTLCRPKSE